jgi:hypothetical protein
VGVRSNPRNHLQKSSFLGDHELKFSSCLCSYGKSYKQPIHPVQQHSKKEKKKPCLISPDSSFTRKQKQKQNIERKKKRNEKALKGCDNK